MIDPVFTEDSFKVLMGIFCAFLSLSGCDVTPGPDGSNLENFSYKDSYSFNFTADAISIAVQQSPGEPERSGITEPTVTITDSTLKEGQVVLTFQVQAFDMENKKIDPYTELSQSHDSLYFWYSEYSSNRFQ